MTKTQKPSSRKKQVAAAGLTIALGCGLLIGGPGTLAGWTKSLVIGNEVIQAGTISQVISSGAWALNGVPLTESQLANLQLSPGDSVAYTATVTPSIDSGLHAEMRFSGVDELLGSLAASPNVSVGWKVSGVQAPLPLSVANSGVGVPVSFSLDVSESAGNETMLRTADLSRIQVVLTQIAGQSPEPPAPTDPEPTEPPVVEPPAPGDGANAWVIDEPGWSGAPFQTAVRAALGSQVGPEEALRNEHKLMITKLEIHSKEFKSAAPIAELTNLVHLDLSNSAANNMAPLADLTKLTHLNMSGTGQFSSNGLAKLTKLTYLNLSNNMEVWDLGPVAGLSSEAELVLTKTKITNWKPVNHIDNVAGRPADWNRTP